jgi:hypothetical protein
MYNFSLIKKMSGEDALLCAQGAHAQWKYKIVYQRWASAWISLYMYYFSLLQKDERGRSAHMRRMCTCTQYAY